MERKIIYYPTILVPAEWQIKTLLYWDKISSIVPVAWDEAISESIALSSPQVKKSYNMMKYLESEGEFEPVRPEYVPLEKEFKQIVESADFKEKINKNWLNSKIPDSAIPMHRDKISTNVYYFLHENDLARQVKGVEDWYLMEKNTSLIFMALLAKYLAEYLAAWNRDYVVTGTDSEEYQTRVFKRDMQEKGFFRLKPNSNKYYLFRRMVCESRT
jgi:hypothetical protein